jgi:hypothetical protein
MHSLKFHIKGRSIKMHKQPREPFVCGKIDEVQFKFSIENNTVTLVFGAIEMDILSILTTIIAQYFLPIRTKKREEK